MEIIIIALIVLLIIAFKCRKTKYDRRGFDKNGIHKNGTKYDEFGYDYTGYDRNGYDCQGYDNDGFDRSGYCKAGYNREGKNCKGQYNRIYDLNYGKDGFDSFERYPIGVTNHARQRIMERMFIKNPCDIDKLVREAYCYGKSKRQIKKSSAFLMEEIENNHENSILLIYRGYIYVFSKDNILITVYKNERIPM